MTLDEWRESEAMRHVLFAKWWRIKHDRDPASFPLDLEPGEWDEQYQTWIGDEQP